MKALREAVEARDLQAVEALLADDVVFRSPAVHTPYQGKAATMHILRAVIEVFEDFRYVTEAGSPDSADSVLVFEAEVEGKQVTGCDILHVGPDGLIDDFMVMVRPLSGLNALASAMRARLTAPGADG